MSAVSYFAMKPLEVCPTSVGQFIAGAIHHRCFNVGYAWAMTPMTRIAMIEELRRLGFSYLPTVSSKWQGSLHLVVASQTLIVLIRSRGVDIMMTSAAPKSLLNLKGQLSVRTQEAGVRFGEYNYTDSDIEIHSSVVSHAQEFVQGLRMDDSYFVRKGIGRSEWGAKYGSRSGSAQRTASDGGGGLSELYAAVSGGDGESAYLGDGVWIGPGGQLDDRG